MFAAACVLLDPRPGALQGDLVKQWRQMSFALSPSVQSFYAASAGAKTNHWQ
jgi:hypothetical protein